MASRRNFLFISAITEEPNVFFLQHYWFLQGEGQTKQGLWCKSMPTTWKVLEPSWFRSPFSYTNKGLLPWQVFPFSTMLLWHKSLSEGFAWKKWIRKTTTACFCFYLNSPFINNLERFKDDFSKVRMSKSCFELKNKSRYFKIQLS